MLNTRGNLVMKGAILTIFLLITCVFVAVGTVDEQIEAEWLGDKIEARAWNFTYPEKCCQIRYYQPDTFDINHIFNPENPTDDKAEPPYNDPNNLNGFYVVNPKFPGNNSLYDMNNPYVENLTSPGNGWVAGEWIVVLLKNGDVVDCSKHSDHKCCKGCSCCSECCNDPHEFANSHRVHCPVNVPIPEFSTIALPIASILGIMFILQNRRRKED